MLFEYTRAIWAHIALVYSNSTRSSCDLLQKYFEVLKITCIQKYFVPSAINIQFHLRQQTGRTQQFLFLVCERLHLSFELGLMCSMYCTVGCEDVSRSLLYDGSTQRWFLDPLPYTKLSCLAAS